MRWVLAMVLAAGPAVAQEVDCAVAEVQVELTWCAEQDWIAADEELNAAYQGALEVVRGTDAALGLGDKAGEGFLRQAQRDWVAFRDNACAAEAWPSRGGSIEPMLIYGCRASLTEERTLGLYYLIELGDR